jgi:DNA-binding transcriptional LysR family regulator
MSEIKPRDFPDIWAFARVVELSSFSEAARQMGSTKANVSKQVARLERSLKVKLLNRSTRRISVSEVGLEIYQHAVRMIDEAKAIEAKIAGLQTGPSGTLRVSTSMALGNAHIAGLLPEFMERYPDVSVVLSLTDRYVDLVEEGFDIALRLAPKISMLSAVARPVAPLNYVLTAAPSYIERHGMPDSIEAIKEHRCMTFGDMSSAATWHLQVGAETTPLKVDSALTINSSQSLRMAMLNGGGIALLPTFVVGQDIEQGRAVHVLPAVKPTGMFGSHLYAVYLQNQFLPQKVRVFIDFLLEKIGERPYWDSFMDAAARLATRATAPSGSATPACPSPDAPVHAGS